ncbi:MAG TPA: flagellar protein FliS, partial [Nitrospinaceae bacterium]|nr:flagellar protein FliS [Nitrospinaceae bacterium]
LDLKKGGEVAQRLESLYQYMLSQLTLANIKSDRKALETVIKILSPLAEAWEQLFHASTNTGEGDHQPPKNIASKC